MKIIDDIGFDGVDAGALADSRGASSPIGRFTARISIVPVSAKRSPMSVLNVDPSGL